MLICVQVDAAHGIDAHLKREQDDGCENAGHEQLKAVDEKRGRPIKPCRDAGDAQHAANLALKARAPDRQCDKAGLATTRATRKVPTRRTAGRDTGAGDKRKWPVIYTLLL